MPAVLLAVLACAVAPACMAQSRADAPKAKPAQPRSAMGRVMGIMIEALRQETLRAHTDATTETMADATPAGGDAMQVIDVGAAFRLPADDRAAPRAAAPPCDVQPCDRIQPSKLRIASQN